MLTAIIFYLCIAIGHGGVELEGNGFFVPVLHDFAEDVGIGPSMDVGDGDVERFIFLSRIHI